MRCAAIREDMSWSFEARRADTEQDAVALSEIPEVQFSECVRCW